MRLTQFWSKVKKTRNCWNWVGLLDKGGYGKYGPYGKAHRISFELANGKTDLWVLHKCNNRQCVNPRHLYAGTREDNVRDAVNSRTHIGFKLAKISDKDVLDIRKLFKSGYNSIKLSELYPLSSRHIRRILSGERRQYV